MFLGALLLDIKKTRKRVNKFVTIERAKNILTGSKFKITTHVDSDTTNSSVITTPNSDGLFTTELAVGDVVEFYDWSYMRRASVTVKTVDSATQFTAEGLIKEEVTRIDENNRNNNKDVITRDIIYKHATFIKTTSKNSNRREQVHNEFNSMRLNLDMIKYYYPDPRYSTNMLIDIGTDTSSGFSTSDIKRDDIKLVSPPSDITFSGTIGTDKNDFIVKGYASGITTDTDYKVEIDGTGTAAVFTVRCEADVEGSLHQTGFKLYSTIEGKEIMVFYVVTGVDSTRDFAVSDIFEFLFVEIARNATASTVASETETVFNNMFGGVVDGGAATYPYALSVSTSIITFTAGIKGTVSVPKDLGTLSNNTIATYSTVSNADKALGASLGISTITCTTGSFVTAGFEAEDVVFLSGFNAKENNNPSGYRVHSVSATKMLLRKDVLKIESEGLITKVTSGPCGFTFNTTTVGVTETFKWSDTGGDIYNATGVTVKGDHLLNNGVIINFNSDYKHTSGSNWTFTCSQSTKIVAKKDIEKLDKLLITNSKELPC